VAAPGPPGPSPASSADPRADPYAILVVDDDLDFARMLERLLSGEGYRTAVAGSARQALEALGRTAFDLVLTDLMMPETGGLSLLETLRQRHPEVDVVIMTGYGTIGSTVEAMRLGAADYVPKPFDTDELLAHVRRVEEVRSLTREVKRLRGELERRYGFDTIIGSSQKMARVFDRVRAAAATASNVLIAGESGTGKELIARAIHQNGARGERRFVAINCAALPREIIESELFGHAKGAFTGAFTEHEGLFRAAHGGSLFLDEVTEMPGETQAKLLRALEEGNVRPIGSTAEVPVDVRIIAAAKDPAEAVRTGRLREDLYYRLAVITIDLPPLRERVEDIPLLAHHFIDELNRRLGRSVRGVEPRAMERLARYPWPGNVRELRNAIEGILALAKTDLVTVAELPPKLLPRPEAMDVVPAEEIEPGAVPPLEETLRQVERKLIRRALEIAGGNKSKAADLLGVSRKRIYRKLEELSKDLPRVGK